jgi:5'-AMP-activated protein kinase catalytic alpha subunit
MSNNGFAGLDNRLVKFKLMYVAQEVRQHNLHPVPRPGFLGAPADMWSAGVLLYQLLCFGYPKGQLALVCDTNWRQNLLKHAYGESGCLGEEGCLICFRAMCFPSVIYEIFRGLLMDGTPSSRLTAVQVCNLLTPLINSLEGIDPVNAFELNPLEL